MAVNVMNAVLISINNIHFLVKPLLLLLRKRGVSVRLGDGLQFPRQKLRSA